MVATTVIEVGVNIPNASVMIIESAKGLAYLNFINLEVELGEEINRAFVF